MSVAITDTGLRLAILDGIKAEDERTLRRLADRLALKKAEAARAQREAAEITDQILAKQRLVAAVTQEMAQLIGVAR